MGARLRGEVWGVTACRPSPNRITRDRHRVSDSSTEDFGSGLELERLCTMPGEVPGASCLLLLLYKLAVRKKLT